MATVQQPHGRHVEWPADDHLEGRLMMATSAVNDVQFNFLGSSFGEVDAYNEPYYFGPEKKQEAVNINLFSGFDLPGFILSYHLGYQKLMQLRNKAERALGEQFSLAEFNDELLEFGILPFDVLEQHIDWYIAQH
ncbi:DUF885 domain-containing protein [Pseudomaricurvus alkylphenolicus]|uniref:DUF885 family protein n=1 Tax=Pseudomaricurvus alkylphenolicus TaxID=1306991 RepID=UPI00142265D6|nr:DUF885 family protein [Pseudomaricurvus alkylphenolicus]NIB45144.1 DUF885 domain-containing protein [Pseudomaricurvus alkylphenolicus]